jgi:hypothetical protein
MQGQGFGQFLFDFDRAHARFLASERQNHKHPGSQISAAFGLRLGETGHSTLIDPHNAWQQVREFDLLARWQQRDWPCR